MRTAVVQINRSKQAPFCLVLASPFFSTILAMGRRRMGHRVRTAATAAAAADRRRRRFRPLIETKQKYNEKKYCAQTTGKRKESSMYYDITYFSSISHSLPLFRRCCSFCSCTWRRRRCRLLLQRSTAGSRIGSRGRQIRAPERTGTKRQLRMPYRRITPVPWSPTAKTTESFAAASTLRWP